MKKKTKKKVVKKIKKTIPPKPVKVLSGLKPLRELALHSPYTMGYLSLMARRKQLKVKKIGRAWYSSLANIKDFEAKMQKQKEERNEQLRKSYIEKAEKVKISVMDNRKADKILREVQEDTKNVRDDEGIDPLVKPEDNKFKPEEDVRIVRDDRGGDTIFDEVQRELGDILQEIRTREKKLRHNYMVHRGDILGKGIDKDLAKEKQITQDLSGQLIDDMGRLLRTASEVHNHAERDSAKSGRQAFKFEKVVENNDHLLGNYHKDNFLSVPYSYFPFEDTKQLARQHSVSVQNKILLFVAGIMVFVAILLMILILFN
jgi:hypothetical protein